MNENSLFAELLQIESPTERSAFLDRTCAEQPQMRARLEQLLRAHNDAGSFLEKPAADLAATQLYRGATDRDDEDVPLDFLEPCDTPGRLGRLRGYEILDVIGRGGMGVVLRAMDIKLNRVVAIKVLAPELASHPQARKRFSREAQAAAAVSHDHVVTIHAVDDDERVPFIVMECIVGQSLQQKIDRVGALGLKEILRIGMQIASGLAAAHKQGLVHRDIKPANILLENGIERVKITDFGLARASDDVGITMSGQIAGTPQYMSPEQAMGQPVDQRSDLFSLGSVLYTMCTGRPAFRADSAVAVLRRVCDDTPRPINEVNAEIPAWLITIVERLISKAAADRFQTAEEVAELLSQCLAHLQQPATMQLPASVTAMVANSASASQKSSGQHAEGWRLRCKTCGKTRSLASVGGVRMGAASVGKVTLGWCSTCQGLKWTAIEWGLIDPNEVPPLEPARSTMRAALGLVATGLVNWLAIFGMLAWVATNSMPEGFESAALPVFSILALGSALILFGAYRMMNLDSYGWAKASAILAMFIGPGYLIGWPVGIWALATLSRADVQDCFRQRKQQADLSATEPVPPRPRWLVAASWVLWTVHVVCGVMFLSPYLHTSHAETSNFYYSIGAPGPWFVYEMVPGKSFHSGMNLISSSILAAIVAWAAYGLLCKLEKNAGQPRFAEKTYVALLAVWVALIGLNVAGGIWTGKKFIADTQIRNQSTAQMAAAGRKVEDLAPLLRIVELAEKDVAVAHAQFAAARVPHSTLTEAEIKLTEAQLRLSAAQQDWLRHDELFAKLTELHREILDTVKKQHAAGVISDSDVRRAETALLEVQQRWTESRSAHSNVATIKLGPGTIDPKTGTLTLPFNPSVNTKQIDFNGDWDSGWGPVKLSHGKVTGIWPVELKGIYQNGKGSIKGGIDPRTGIFRGTFHEPNGNGRLQLALSADGREIDGGFDYLSEPLEKVPPMQPWRMTRQTPYVATAPFDAGQAKLHQEAWAQYLGLDVELTNSIGMKLRLIPPGEFTQGTAPRAADQLAANPDWYFARWVGERRQTEAPPRAVTISQAMYVGAHEVTVGQFAEFLKDTKYKTEAETESRGGYAWLEGRWQRSSTASWHNAGFVQTDDHPVCNVAWQDAVAFCKWLSQREGVTYRLPTEAEWEYACRAGTTTLFSTGDDPTSLDGSANVADAAVLEHHKHITWAMSWNDGFAFTAPVGSFKSNNFGLFDMHGNVHEWCVDQYDAHAYAQSPATDPIGPNTGSQHIYRGGGWDNWVGFSRSADRYGSHSDLIRTQWAGFRVVREAKANPQPRQIVNASIDLNGEWTSRWGIVKFTHTSPLQANDSLPVKATYYDNAGTIEGVIDIASRTFVGRFRESNGMNGPLRLVISPDGRSIKGLYEYRQASMQADPTDLKLTWDMDRKTELPTNGIAPPPPRATAPFNAEQAKLLQEGWAKYLAIPIVQTNSVGMKLQLIPPGRFQMGSTPEELAQLKKELEDTNASDFDKFVAQSSGPRHVVELTEPFYMGQHEVTVAQFRQFVEATNYRPSAEDNGSADLTWKKFIPDTAPEKQPVCGVSWEDARAFCRWLSDQTKSAYNLPTEAQWEYACRAGSQALWSFGDDPTGLSEHAIVGAVGTPYPAEIGLKRANAFGLFDMHGNVDEWCLDWHNKDFYTRSPLVDPSFEAKPQDAASGRVARGGSWNAKHWWSRSATRAYDFPAKPTFPKGFRVVLKAMKD